MARIVLIDDEAALRGVMAEILANAGHETTLASGGNEGLDALRQQMPDVVLCDINMPGVDGFGVLKAVRADPQLAPLPFIFLTSEADVRAGLRVGRRRLPLQARRRRWPCWPPSTPGSRDARRTRREADRRVGEIRRAVAALLPHELRTPLTTIIGSARLLQEFHRDFGPEEIDEMAGGILSAALRLQRMAENYILYADLETQRLSARPRRLGAPRCGSSGAVDADVRGEGRRGAERARPADLELDVREVTVAMGLLTSARSVTELCDNAFKFSAAGTPVHVSLGTAGGGDGAGSRRPRQGDGPRSGARGGRLPAVRPRAVRAAGIRRGTHPRPRDRGSERRAIRDPQPASEGTTVRIVWPA